MLGVAQAFGRHPARAAALAPPRARRGDALPHALADDVALHLGEGRLDLQEGAAHGGGGVEISVQRAEADAAALQLIHQPDQLAGEPPEAVEVEHDQYVALAQVVQACLEARPVDVGPAAAVVKDAVAPGDPEGVDLAVEPLPLLAGGHPSIADLFHVFRSHPLTTTSTREGYPSTDCCGVVVKEKVRFGGPARRSRQRHGCREPTLVTDAHGAAEVLP